MRRFLAGWIDVLKCGLLCDEIEVIRVHIYERVHNDEHMNDRSYE